MFFSLSSINERLFMVVDKFKQQYFITRTNSAVIL
jgi:hypothetical protein